MSQDDVLLKGTRLVNERIKSLDALRAIAISLVVLAHIVLGYGAPEGLAPLQFGGVGVDLFFVLSGWLLGGQLFKESRAGTLNVYEFWRKRWYRTLPAYYAVLGFTILQQYLTKSDFSAPLEYFIFLQNYDLPLEIFYISWSLSVEEQFYLFIAPTIFLITKASRHKQLLLLVILLLTPSIFRFLGLYEDTIQTHVRVDGCIAGVLLAFLKNQYESLWNYLKDISGFLFTISLGMFFYFAIQRWIPAIPVLEFGYLERAFVFSTWVLYANSSASKQSKSFPGAYYIATRSYSMYLLHPDAIAATNRFFSELSFFSYLMLVSLITIVTSELLYKFVELPGMNLRDKRHHKNNIKK